MLTDLHGCAEARAERRREPGIVMDGYRERSGPIIAYVF
jgi:hypothetical protein